MSEMLVPQLDRCNMICHNNILLLFKSFQFVKSINIVSFANNHHLLRFFEWSLPNNCSDEHNMISLVYDGFYKQQILGYFKNMKNIRNLL